MNDFILCDKAQTDFMQVGDRQFCVNIPDADNINHVVVFLTGTMPLPENMSAAGSKYKTILFGKKSIGSTSNFCLSCFSLF